MKQSDVKFCTLPGSPIVRCSSTNGQVCLIGTKPRHIPAIFVQEALGKGAITEAQLERVRVGATSDEDLAPFVAVVVNSTPGMADGERFARIVQAMNVIIDAGEVADFTQQGIVRVEAVSAATGFEVTAAERDTAFAEIKKG
jgi:hypothetical protein